MNNENEDLKGSILLPRGEENKISKYRVNKHFCVTVIPDRDKGHYMQVQVILVKQCYYMIIM